jgi:hypothetical protein
VAKHEYRITVFIDQHADEDLSAFIYRKVHHAFDDLPEATGRNELNGIIVSHSYAGKSELED